MDKTENCFSTTIQLSEYTDFNFCFKDSYNNWDNNNSCDYSLKIEVKKDSTSDLNALLDDILNETKTSKIETTPLEDSISKIQKISDTFDELFEETKTYDSVTPSYYFIHSFIKLFLKLRIYAYFVILKQKRHFDNICGKEKF